MSHGESRERSESLFARGPRRFVALGSALLALGLLLVATAPSDEGMAITLIALSALVFGVHSFGRLGPDAPALEGSAEVDGSR
jgi:hypothetical protein